MTSKWFWCPKCRKIAPSLTRWQFYRVRLKHTKNPDAGTIFRRIVFMLANPALTIRMAKISLQRIRYGHRSLRCGPCRCDMGLIGDKDPRIFSAPNFEDFLNTAEQTKEAMKAAGFPAEFNHWKHSPDKFIPLTRGH